MVNVLLFAVLDWKSMLLDEDIKKEETLEFIVLSKFNQAALKHAQQAFRVTQKHLPLSRYFLPSWTQL